MMTQVPEKYLFDVLVWPAVETFRRGSLVNAVLNISMTSLRSRAPLVDAAVLTGSGLSAVTPLNQSIVSAFRALLVSVLNSASMGLVADGCFT